MAAVSAGEQVVDLFEVTALRTVLACDTEDIPDWQERVETLKILNAGKVHDRFEAFRAVVRASPSENLLPSDLDSVVRRLLDTALEPDDPHPSQPEPPSLEE